MPRRLSVMLVALAGAPLVSGAKPAPLTGIWGAPGAALTLKVDGGQLEQDCAHSTLGAVTLDRKGRFKVSGTIEPYGSGPQQAGGPPASVAAIFSGEVSAGKLDLTVTPKGRKPEHYSLVEGRRVKIIRCL